MTWRDGRAYISLTYGGQRHRQRVSNPDLHEDLLCIERERAARERRALVADLGIDDSMLRLERMTQALVGAELEALGYHQHKGEWRVRRGSRGDLSRVGEQEDGHVDSAGKLEPCGGEAVQG